MDDIDEEKILKQLMGSLTTIASPSAGPRPAGSTGGRRPLPVVNQTQRDQVCTHDMSWPEKFWNATHQELDSQQKAGVNKVRAIEIDTNTRNQFWQQHQDNAAPKITSTQIDIDHNARNQVCSLRLGRSCSSFGNKTNNLRPLRLLSLKSTLTLRQDNR